MCISPWPSPRTMWAKQLTCGDGSDLGPSLALYHAPSSNPAKWCKLSHDSTINITTSKYYKHYKAEFSSSDRSSCVYLHIFHYIMEVSSITSFLTTSSILEFSQNMVLVQPKLMPVPYNRRISIVLVHALILTFFSPLNSWILPLWHTPILYLPIQQGHSHTYIPSIYSALIYPSCSSHSIQVPNPSHHAALHHRHHFSSFLLFQQILNLWIFHCIFFITHHPWTRK